MTRWRAGLARFALSLWLPLTTPYAVAQPPRLALPAALPPALPPAMPNDAEAARIADALRAVQAAERRIAAIGFRLAQASRVRCSSQAALPGLALHSLSAWQPSWRPVVAHTFGLAGGTAIIALVPGAPAAAAGLREGDRLLRVDGETVAPASGPAALAETDAWRAAIERAFADGDAVFEVERGGAPVRVAVTGAHACAVAMQLELDDRYIAAANGRRIRLSTGVVAFAASDDELASVIAHELAHNILGHRARLDAAGVSRGLARAVGIGAGPMRRMELEADRLSLQLMAAAGYDPAAALAYIERAVRRPDYREGPTHPSARDRIAAVRAALAALPRS